MVNGADAAVSDRYGYAFEPAEAFSYEPLGFAERTMRLQTEALELFDMVSTVSRFSPLFFRMSAQLERMLTRLGGCCVTKAALEQQAGESFRLLEETFGLPFDVVYEQEEIEKIKKSDETWKILKAREKEFQNRPNRFELELLPPEQWPESVRNQEEQSPYMLRLSPDYHEITCVDPEGRTRWTFAPGLNGMREQLQFVQADLDEAVIQVCFHDENRDRNDKVCRLAAADGAMLTEYVLPDSAKRHMPFTGIRIWDVMYIPCVSRW